MKTLSFINLKGGVGKTTLSTNLSYLAAEAWGLHVLFIDNDKQSNASRWFDADEEAGSLTNILMDDAKASEVIQHARYEGIDFIAADMGLIEANYAVIADQETRQDVILKNALTEVSGHYDLCIIDNPPDINMSVFNALTVTDDVIIVTLLEQDSIEGIYKIVQQVEDVRQFNPKIAIKGILINQYIAYPEVLNVYKELCAANFPIFRTRISYASRPAKHHLMTASRYRQSIFEVSQKCRVARDIDAFAEELLTGGTP